MPEYSLRRTVMMEKGTDGLVQRLNLGIKGGTPPAH